MKNARIWALTLMLLGCSPAAHTAERVENAATGAVHQLGLEECLKAESTALKSGVTSSKAHVDYVACANAADVKAGKK